MSDEMPLVEFREKVMFGENDQKWKKHNPFLYILDNENQTVVHAEGGITYDLGEKYTVDTLVGNFIIAKCGSLHVLYYFGKEILTGYTLLVKDSIMNTAIVECDGCLYLVKDGECRKLGCDIFRRPCLLSEDEILFIESNYSGLKIILKDFNMNILNWKYVQCVNNEGPVATRHQLGIFVKLTAQDDFLLVDKDFGKNRKVTPRDSGPAHIPRGSTDIFPNIKKFLILENNKYAIYGCYSYNLLTQSGVLIVKKSDENKYQFLPKMKINTWYERFYNSFIIQDDDDNIYICDLMDNVINMAMSYLGPFNGPPRYI